MRAEKQFLLDEIREKIQKSPAFIVTRYHNLSAMMANDLRTDVNAKGGDFEVVRKRVFLKATTKEGIELNSKDFEGHIAVMFTGEDVVETTKAIVEYGKSNKDTIEFVTGQFDGKLLSSTDIQALATLPSKEIMQAQFLGLLEAPMAETLSVMNALLTSVPHCLENKVDLEQKK